MSPALELLTTVWRHGMKDAWTRINQAMRQALALAIGAGLRFDPDDFSREMGNFRWGYWVGDDEEWIYSAAVLNLNKSCIAAFEAYKERKPFLGNDVKFGYQQNCYLHINSPERKRDRLTVGVSLPLNGRFWWVTGFDDAGGAVRLASYAGRQQQGRPEKLMRLTHEELAVLCPAPKKPKKIKTEDSE